MQSERVQKKQIERENIGVNDTERESEKENESSKGAKKNTRVKFSLISEK